MTYHTDNRIRKYMQGYGFLSFSKKFGSKYSKYDKKNNKQRDHFSKKKSLLV